MLDPYRMVLVNVIASCLVFGGVLFYRYIYPKKKINLFVLLLIISVLPIISIFRTGAYESGDFNIHVRRSMEFYQLLTEGNLIPSWAGSLNATYGYPLYAFNYILPYYIISFFHFIGFSFIASLKLFLGTTFILSGIFMYAFSKSLLKNSLAGFAAAIFYLFTPYHLISTHFKITIGEILAYTLIPIVFYFINKFLVEKKVLYFLLSGLSLGLLILSHIFVAVFLIPVIIIYIVFETKKFFKGILYSFGIIVISLLISMFQWTAPLIYRPYLFTAANPSDPGKAFYFPNILDLLYSPWRFGLLFQGPKGELSFLLGYAQLLALLIIILLLIKNKMKKGYRKMVIFWIVLFFAAAFLITPYSIFIWRYLPLVNEAGSQRLLILTGFFTSLFAGYVALTYGKRKLIIYGLIIFAVLTTMLNWGQRRVIPAINDNVLKQDISLGTGWGDTHFYALPKWVNPKQPWFADIPKYHLEILQGKASIVNTYRSSTKHVYGINAQTNINLKENTLYFPGWTATSNNKLINIKPDKTGVINLSLPRGKHLLTLSYEDLPMLAITKKISLLSIVLIISYFIYYLFKKIYVKTNSKVLNKD